MLHDDINKKAAEKLAGIMDSIGGMVPGSQGTINTPAMGLGGGALGAMAGAGLSAALPQFKALKALAPLGGAAIGGLMGAGGANAINTQGAMQDKMDMGLLRGMNAGLSANDSTDMAQSHAIAEQGHAINILAQAVSSLLQPPPPMELDPSMIGMDPAMMGEPEMVAPPAQAPADTKSTGPENNGLGEKQGSMLDRDIEAKTAEKLASLFRIGQEDGSSWLPAISGLGAATAGGLGGYHLGGEALDFIGDQLTTKDMARTYRDTMNRMDNVRGVLEDLGLPKAGWSSSKTQKNMINFKNNLLSNPIFRKYMPAAGAAGALGLGTYGLGKLLFD